MTLSPIDFFLFASSFLEITSATNTTQPILMNSAGWKVIGPSLIQRTAPWELWPKSFVTMIMPMAATMIIQE